MLFLLTGCQSPDMLRIIYLIKQIIKIGCILIPIALIVFVILDLMKAMSTSDDKSRAKSISLVIKRFLYTIVLFFIPSLINLVFNMLENTNVNYVECWDNAEKETISYYQELQDEEDEVNKIIEDQYQKAKVESAISKMKEQNESYYLSGKGKIANGTIFVGDSRMNQLCRKLQAASLMEDTEQCVTKGAEAYSWFVETAIAEIDAIMAENSSYIYNVVINLGVNDLKYKGDAAEYISKYNELKKGKWSKHNIIIVSVDPTDPNVFAGTSFYNSIKTFNEYLEKGLDETIYYCNTFDIVDNLIKTDSTATSDGLHYSAGTYQIIYESMKTCIDDFAK